MAFRSLVSAVSEQYQEIRQTLSSISYFSVWDASVITECCRLSSLAEFSPKEVILGSGTGNSHMVYFILDGVCRMIQYLQVESKATLRSEMKYNLYKALGETLNYESGNIGYASLLFNKKHGFQMEEILSQHLKNEQEHTQGNKRTEEIKSKNKLFVTDEIDSAPDNSICAKEPINVKPTENSNEIKADIIYDDHHVRILQECRKKLQDIIWVNETYTTREKPKNVKGYFIQTGFLFKGACFGLKKYTNKNFIMSETTVKCLKIPQRFLLQHNPCNIWNRILLFDSLYQPKEEKILENFRIERKWQEGKKKLVENIRKKKIPNFTGISDIPYSIRLTDAKLCNTS